MTIALKHVHRQCPIFIHTFPIQLALGNHLLTLAHKTFHLPLHSESTMKNSRTRRRERRKHLQEAYKKKMEEVEDGFVMEDHQEECDESLANEFQDEIKELDELIKECDALINEYKNKEGEDVRIVERRS